MLVLAMASTLVSSSTCSHNTRVCLLILCSKIYLDLKLSQSKLIPIFIMQVSFFLGLGDGLSWQLMEPKLNYVLHLFNDIPTSYLSSYNKSSKGSVDFLLLMRSIYFQCGNNSTTYTCLHNSLSLWQCKLYDILHV